MSVSPNSVDVLINITQQHTGIQAEASNVDGSASDEVNKEIGDSRAEMLDNNVTERAKNSESEEDSMLDTGDKP
jgi:hypothetical protein